MSSNIKFAATIGLDWADQKHDLWLRPADGAKAEHVRLEQTPEALHAWVAALRKRFGNQPVAIAIETSRGAVVSALRGYDFIVLFPVNPKALKDYRSAFAVSGAKDDRTDAQLLEEFIRLHGDKLRALHPDTELTRKLAGLVEYRRQLVDQRTRFGNQLHATLKIYYPLGETLVGEQINQPLAAEFLARWPDFESVKKAQAQTLRAFFFKHHSRSPKLVEERLAAIAQAQPLTADPATIEPARALVGALAAMLRPLHKALAQLDQQIEQAMDQHPEAALFRSLPGAGPALAPRLLVAFGTDRGRFASAAEVAQFYGLAPVVVQSGNSKTVHMRYRCPKFGRQTFHENAGCALRKEPWARCYYAQQKERHDGHHHQACRALAFKLIRIYFACWRDRQLYDPAKYLQALETNGSPLLAKLENSTKAACE